MQKQLPASFFNRDTETVAQELLGKFLVREKGGEKVVGMVVETEAYVGAHDLACHASRGRTPRTETMFGPAGVWYVYLVYGFYHCLNVVTESEGDACAVLVRAVEPIEGIEMMLSRRGKFDVRQATNGPGKLCVAFGIDRDLNAMPAYGSEAEMFFEDRGIRVAPSEIARSPRIGVDYAQEWKDKPLRFTIAGNPFVSKSPRRR
jgi:DNA-3-methyladenine glycosylase